MNQKKNKGIDTNDLMFNEEVHEDELYSKVDVDDHIYIKDDKSVRKRIVFIVVLIIILLLISLFSSLYGFALLNKDDYNTGGSGAGTNVVKYDLFVEHSDSSYGGIVDSFDNYNSLEKAFTYDFNVSNDNPVALDYDVEIIGLSDGIDMSLINYSLVKNNNEVVTGILSDITTSKIYSTDILSNAKDEYVVKFWSDKIKGDMKFSFKINITV